MIISQLPNGKPESVSHCPVVNKEIRIGYCRVVMYNRRITILVRS